jgi:hypothetical protein
MHIQIEFPFSIEKSRAVITTDKLIEKLNHLPMSVSLFNLIKFIFHQRWVLGDKLSLQEAELDFA